MPPSLLPSIFHPSSRVSVVTLKKSMNIRRHTHQEKQCLGTPQFYRTSSNKRSHILAIYDTKLEQKWHLFSKEKIDDKEKERLFPMKKRIYHLGRQRSTISPTTRRRTYQTEIWGKEQIRSLFWTWKSNPGFSTTAISIRIALSKQSRTEQGRNEIYRPKSGSLFVPPTIPRTKSPRRKNTSQNQLFLRNLGEELDPEGESELYTGKDCILIRQKGWQQKNPEGHTTIQRKKK